MRDYDLKGTIGMNEFGDHKTNRGEERGNAGQAAIKLGVDHANSNAIGQLLHRRYDGTLTETLPDSFVSLLKELDRRLPDQKDR